MARMSRRVLLAMSRAERVKDRARRALGVLKAFSVSVPGGLELSIDVDALTGTADSGDLDDDLSDLLVALGQVATDADSGVVFLLDEIQFLDQRSLEALISALHRVASFQTLRYRRTALAGGVSFRVGGNGGRRHSSPPRSGLHCDESAWVGL